LDFNYTPKETKDCVLATEGKLQNLVHVILTRQYGPSWENDPNISWGKNKRQGIENRRAKRDTEFYAHANSERLIDYCYLLDLEEILEKNEALFKPIFRQWNKTLTMLDIIGPLRNTAMHPHDMPVYQQYLCLGICSEFLQIVEAWELGKFRTIKSYQITMDWVGTANESDTAGAQAKIMADAQAWLDKVKMLATGPITDTVIEGRGNGGHIIPLKEGEMRITKPYPMPRTSPTASIYLETDSFDAMDKVLSVQGHRGYWVLEWIMPDPLDVASMVKRVNELTGKQAASYGRSPFNYDQTSTTYVEHVEYTLLRDSEWWLSVQIFGGNSPLGTRMTLIADYTAKNNLFLNAHKVFNPDVILSFVYGEKGIPALRVALKNAQYTS